MKQLTITFFLSIISVLCLAQTPFTEQLFLDNAKKMEKDPVQALKNNAVPDYVFVGTGGFVTDLKGLIALYDNFTPVSFTPTDYKIRTYGNSAIVTGRLKHSYTNKKTGAPRILDELITYTYALINGEWRLTSSQHSEAPIDRNIEETAIKKTLDEQVRLHHAGDKEVFKKLWKDDPKNFQMMSGTAGEFLVFDNETIKQRYTTIKASGYTPFRTNYQIKVIGNIAVAHYDQENKSNDGKKRTEHNLHILEKVSGDWKIIGASIHPNNLANEDNPEEIAKQWIAEYNKDNKAFFMNKCTEDFIASNSNSGGKFFGKEFVAGVKEGQISNAEISNIKSFQSGDLAVVMSNMIWHHKQADGSDNADKTVSTFVMQKKEGKWLYAGYHSSTLVEEKPEAVLQKFLTEYHKNPKTFFESRLPEDFRYLTGGKQFETKEVVLSRSSANPTDSEVSDLKAFQNGNLGIISGVHIFKNRQADGNIQANKVAFTYTMVKKNGKWFFAESHHTPVKE